NPDPLSPAQQALVDRVERAGVAPYSLRVCAGFLYSSPRDDVRLPRVASELELAARTAPIEHELARLVDDPPLELDAAIARHVEFYRLWAGELAPWIRGPRRVLP